MTGIRKRPRYGDRLSKSVDASGWSMWEKPVHDGYRMACCSCGLIHRVNFRIRKRMVEMQFKIDRRATAAMRRGKRYVAIREALRS